jgi:hypothetical protein
MGGEEKRILSSVTPRTHQRTPSMLQEGIMTERPMVIEENKFEQTENFKNITSILEEPSARDLIQEIEEVGPAADQCESLPPLDIPPIKLQTVYPLKKTYLSLGKEITYREKHITLSGAKIPPA